MAQKNKVKVMIEGKMITLGGYESQEYLERVAFYVNKKIGELSELPGYSRQTDHMKSILLALNITDDYFKAKNRAEHLETDIEEKDENAYEIRQDLVNAQIKIQDLTAEIAALKRRLNSDGSDPAADPEEHAASEHASEVPSLSDDDYYFDEEDSEPQNIQPAKTVRQSKRYVKNRNNY